MARDRTTTRTPIAIRNSFVPRFFDELDQRTGIYKELASRYDALKRDVGIDSFQKDVLCKRFIFLSAQLESMEILALETGEFDQTRYSQLNNTLIGIARLLGIERQTKEKVLDLETYLKAKAASA